MKYKCTSCNIDYLNMIDEEFKKRFKHIFKFSKNDVTKFILLLRKGVCPYQYMDEWEKFNETSLLEKEKFYSNLIMEDITDAAYMHVKRYCKAFEIRSSGKYHDLYLKSIHYFWLMFHKPQKNVFKYLSFRFCKNSFSSTIPWQAALKKTEVKLELLTDIDLL